MLRSVLVYSPIGYTQYKNKQAEEVLEVVNITRYIVIS